MKASLDLRTYLSESLPGLAAFTLFGAAISGVAYAVLTPGPGASAAELRAFYEDFDFIMERFVWPMYTGGIFVPLLHPLLRRWWKLMPDPPPQLSPPPTELLLPPGSSAADDAGAARQALAAALKKAGFRDVRPGERYLSGNWGNGLELRVEEVRFGKHSCLRLRVLSRSLLPSVIPTPAIENSLLALEKALAKFWLVEGRGKLEPSPGPAAASADTSAGGVDA